MVMSRAGWVLRQVLRNASVRVVVYAILAIATAALAPRLSPFIPSDWDARIGADAVDDMLGILASSMLVVTTFSLSVAVSAFSSASNNATPRATRLLQQDQTTQNVLATFLGAFVFSLVGMVALKAGYYDGSGRFLLFCVTALVVVGVVAALLRWIGHLMRFGLIEDTLDRVERAALDALRSRLASPCLGCQPLVAGPPAGAFAVTGSLVGYVQHIDIEKLSEAAEHRGGNFWVEAVPGSLVHPEAALVWADGPALSEEHVAEIRAAFTCANERSFDQDPRFGLIVLSEIASRALSPAVNDPGTAIGVVSRLVRVLSAWTVLAEEEVRFGRLFVPPLRADELLDDGFRPIARDGAAMVEVQIRLQKALGALASLAPEVFARAAVAASDEALERARQALLLDRDLSHVTAAAVSWRD